MFFFQQQKSDNQAQGRNMQWNHVYGQNQQVSNMQQALVWVGGSGAPNTISLFLSSYIFNYYFRIFNMWCTYSLTRFLNLKNPYPQPHSDFFFSPFSFVISQLKNISAIIIIPHSYSAVSFSISLHINNTLPY